MNQKLRYLGLLAILPLLTVALSSSYIGEADALGPKAVAEKIKALQEPKEKDDPFKGHSGSHGSDKTIKLSSKAIRYGQAAEKAPVELSLITVFEPAQSFDEYSEAYKQKHESATGASEDDTLIFRAVYRVVNAGDGDVMNVKIFVQSDTETIQTMLQGKLDPKHSVVVASIKALDPDTISARIIAWES